MQMPADGYDDSLSKRRRRVLEANRAAAKFFHSSLLSENGKTALSYYLNRGLTKKYNQIRQAMLPIHGIHL